MKVEVTLVSGRVVFVEVQTQEGTDALHCQMKEVAQAVGVAAPPHAEGKDAYMIAAMQAIPSLLPGEQAEVARVPKWQGPADVEGCDRCGCRLAGELYMGPACRCAPLGYDQGLVALGATKMMNENDPTLGLSLIKEGHALLVAGGDHEGARHALIVADSILAVKK